MMDGKTGQFEHVFSVFVVCFWLAKVMVMYF